MNSLIIGSTSQLAYYFPFEFEKISSRFIRENLPLPLKEDYYDRVYITFAEQRFNEITDIRLYIEVNTIKTMQLVNFFKDKANAVIVYGSCELWNDYYGAIDLSLPFKYSLESPYAGYCISKKKMVEEIHELNVNNVFVLHPFNFNSPYRKPGFLFSKIFDSIINKKKIELGDTYFYRDLVHPKYVVERSMKATSDEIIGSGRLTFINDFIRTLYELNNMNYDEWVTENIIHNKIPTKKILYLKSKKQLYKNLIVDTLNDINEFKL